MLALVKDAANLVNEIYSKETPKMKKLTNKLAAINASKDGPIADEEEEDDEA